MSDFQNIKDQVKQHIADGQLLFQELEKIEKDEKARTKTIDNVVAMLNEGDEVIKGYEFVEFLKKPYVLMPDKHNSVFVVVPKFIKDFQVGWLYKETDTFYIYQFDQYSAWLSDAPEEILDAVDIGKHFELDVVGDQVHFNASDKGEIKKKLGDHLSSIDDTSAKIKRGHIFDVIADTVKFGHLPFKAKVIDKDDLRKPQSNIVLRDYQQDAFNRFKETGAVGVFHPTGAGKTYVALYALDVIKGKKLVIVPSRMLVEQWQYRINELLPHCKDEIKVTTYQGYKGDGSFALTIYDECQRLPANSFSRLAVVDTKYRIGLSASPHREDGRENYIFALTGFPIGLNWPEYMKNVKRDYHPIFVHRVPGQSKIAKVGELLDYNKKTIIFCDGIELGARIAKKYNVPHIHGGSSNRLQEIADNKVVVMSRVGDLGVSINDLDHVIEVDFLFGSRQQELQRTGRLMHSTRSGKHDIIMTDEEFSRHGKRLWALQEKGFTIKVV